MLEPDFDFRGWFPWTSLLASNGTDNTPEDNDDLSRVGCYLLAHFDAPPKEKPHPTAPEIFYIGETHGLSRSLHDRLREFGKSAGLFGRQVRGHYPAWWYPWRFAEQRNHESDCTSGDRIWVAVQPWPGSAVNSIVRPDQEGIFPALIEAKALWAHSQSCGGLPLLNRSGRRQSVGAAQPPATVTAALFDPSKAPKAAGWLAQWMSVQLGAKPWALKPWEERSDGWSWHGSQVPTRRDGLLYVGRRRSGDAVRVRLWFGRTDDDKWFDEEVTGAEQLFQHWNRAYAMFVG